MKTILISLVFAIGLTPVSGSAPQVLPDIIQPYLIAYGAIPSVTEPSSVESYIRKVFGANALDALRIAKCESGLNPKALNNNPKTRDYSVGVFQINLYGKLAQGRPSETWLKDYRNNIDYAYSMYLKKGWQPWSCK